ncbi:50S ribosomal protein L28 [candidate division WOR_3 bacterium SM1_77]|jgi:large subunit ribosomal protein L28|uniref:Large ribosomal subunit protein bL28 n=1 Tax=candidate division WOR_3 bacterium SM1_77 TaxID=1703778 RepID=A0A0S8JWC4_UNCW3|nr:MAG: 50S ribosomal protein L28 [candidate division WOR_3 bacterium SM1_77]
MARRCAICGRGARVGSNVSHAENVSKRKFRINLQRVKVRKGGEIKRLLVCTRCLHAGKVNKVK